jgi:hypothetical protein
VDINKECKCLNMHKQASNTALPAVVVTVLLVFKSLAFKHMYTAGAFYSRTNLSFNENRYLLATRPFYSEAHSRGLYTAMCIIIFAVMY